VTTARERTTGGVSAEQVGAVSLGRSWLPTAFGSSLLAWEIPLVVAIVGRMPDGPSAMAALGAGLSVLVVVNSPALALAQLVVAELRGRGSRVLLRRAAATGAFGCAALAGLALLPGFPALLGLPPALRGDFRACLLSFATAPLAVALRRYLHGRLIHHDTTRPIAEATMARITLTVVAGLLLRWAGIPSAWLGGLALSCGAWVEAGYLAVTARRLDPAPPPGEPAGRVSLQHARITSIMLLNMSPALVTTIVIARSNEATASLVVWPVLYGLVSLGTVPLSDLDAVGAAFLRRAGRHSVLLRFTLVLAGVLLAVALLIALTPLARLYIVDFSNVPSGPADLGLRWMAVLAAAPPLWAIRGRLRALAIAGERTQALPRAAGVHLMTLLGLGALLPLSPLPGVACAALAIIGALTAEILLLQVMSGPAVTRPSSGVMRGV
jgi:hypothetical protein